MTTNIDEIIVVNEQEIITTSIDGYFKNLAVVAKFENSSLNTGVLFPQSGYKEYESLPAVGEDFPTTHPVYKACQKVFAQKVNTGMNKSAVEKVAVCQILLIDDSVEAGLMRIGYTNAYQWVYVGTNDADIISFTNYFADKRKIPHVQTSEAEVLTNDQVTPSIGDPYDNIAKVLKDANKKAVLYYHAVDEEALNGAMASIYCFATPGRISGVFNKVSNITVDQLNDNQKGNLDTNYVNYYTPYIGQAGSYMTRNLTAGGRMSNGEEVQQQIILDRIILNLQSAGMDALEMQIPYDDRGGAVLESKLKAVLIQLQNEGLIASDSLADDGTIQKGQTLNVLSRETTKRQFPSYFAEKCFIAQATAEIALNAKKVQINLVYQA